jgi:hypothetical protein
VEGTVHLRAPRNDVKTFVLDCDTGVFPRAVFGPVDFLAFLRLASILRCEIRSSGWPRAALSGNDGGADQERGAVTDRV